MLPREVKAMSDLISREAALEKIGEAFRATDPKGEEQFGILKCSRMVREMPAVDAVEVVRCKDCAEYIPWLYGDRICGRIGSYFGNTKPDDYCSRGRKK